MNSYDPDRLRAELGAAPAPTFDDDLADRAVGMALGRRRRRVAGLSAAAVVVIAAASAVLVPPLLDRGPITAVPEPSASVSPSSDPTPSAGSEPSASSEHSASAVPPASAPPTGGERVSSERLVTASGIGHLQVGMTMAAGKAAGLATDQAVVCSEYDLTEEGAARYPGIWTYWTSEGLVALAVNGFPGGPEEAAAQEYATEKEIRVGDTMAEVDAAYGASAVSITGSSEFWRGGPTETGLPGGASDLRMVLDGDRALVFVGDEGVVRYIVVTTRDADGKLENVASC